MSIEPFNLIAWVGHSGLHALQGLPHSFLLCKKLNILTLPKTDAAAPKGHKKRQKALSINKPTNNIINTHIKAIIGALNLNVIALLKGSIELKVKPKSKEYKNITPNINSKTYLIFLR